MVRKFRQKDIDLVRYNHLLPNGNILLVCYDRIVELSPEIKVVWQVSKAGVSWADLRSRPGIGGLADPREQGFYKAERLPAKK